MDALAAPGPRLRRRASDHAATIVMYHAVDPRPHRYAVDPQAFRRQVEVLGDRYHIVPLSALAERGDGSAERVVAITFDDAYRDFLDHAYPVLAELGLPWTMFVPTGFIGRTNVWDAGGDDYVRREIMTADELRTLAHDPLAELGSHTVDHVRMTHLVPGEMRRQALGSKHTLEALGATVCSFAYPYGQLGDFSTATMRVIVDAGYTVAVTTHWGTCERGCDSFTLRRVELYNQDDPATLQGKVEGRYNWMALKERTSFVFRTVRGTIGR